MILTPEELVRVRAQAEAEYPAECCGVLLARSAPEPDRALMPCRNIQDELHAQDPARHPRDSRTAYFSPTDRQNALINGEPAYPDAVYVVFSVLAGRVADAAAFVWDTSARDFVPTEFPKP